MTHEDMVGPARAGHEVAKGENIRNAGNVTSCARNFKSHHFIWHLEQLPGELRPVIERCMAADPARRPTASQLLTELTADRPAAVSEFGGWPAGTQTTGAAPTGPGGGGSLFITVAG